MSDLPGTRTYIYDDPKDRRIAELEAELSEKHEDHATVTRKANQFRLERDRLREALQNITMMYDPQYGCPCSDVNRMANKALEDSDE